MKLQGLKKVLNRKLPDWLDKPIEGCLLVCGILFVVGLFIWLAK